jgi:formylmethanofuran dehydrogenase subunit E
MKLSDYDKSHFGESGTKNSNTLTFSAAKCADCEKWFPTRYMFWNDRNLCKDCYSKGK